MTETPDQRRERQRAEWQAKKDAGLVIKTPGTTLPPPPDAVHWNGAGTHGAICGVIGRDERINQAKVTCKECRRILRARVGGPKT